MRRITRTFRAMAAVGLLVCFPAAADAATINVGTVELWENMPNQSWQFFVSGGEQVGGLEFDIQVGDGGAANGGTDVGPTITSVNLLNGSIFDVPAYDPFQYTQESQPLLFQKSVTFFEIETVPATGLIATVTFDTTGIFAGTEMPLLLSGVKNQFNTHFTDVNGTDMATVVTNGTIVINAIPEPASLIHVSALALIGAVIFWRRRSR